MRNNAQKHLKRTKLGGGGGTYEQSYQYSGMFLDKFVGDSSVNAMACFVPSDEDEPEGKCLFSVDLESYQSLAIWLGLVTLSLFMTCQRFAI